MSRKPGSGGYRPGSGRPKGAQNVISAEVKEALAKAFKKLGGAKYLEQLGRTDPKAFCSLLNKLIPTEIAQPDGPLKHEVVLKWMTPEMAANRGYDFGQSNPNQGTTGRD